MTLDPGTINVILNLVAVLLGGAALGVILRYKLGVKKLVADEKADVLGHLGREAQSLRDELNRQDANFREVENHLRGLLTSTDERLGACEKARSDSRREIDGLHRELAAHQSEIDGLKRQIVRYSADKVIELSATAPDAENSAPRVISEIDKQENGG